MKKWRNAVRHNLSSHRYFCKTSERNSQGHFWSIHPLFMDEIVQTCLGLDDERSHPTTNSEFDNNCAPDNQVAARNTNRKFSRTTKSKKSSKSSSSSSSSDMLNSTTNQTASNGGKLVKKKSAQKRSHKKGSVDQLPSLGPGQHTDDHLQPASYANGSSSYCSLSNSPSRFAQSMLSSTTATPNDSAYLSSNDTDVGGGVSSPNSSHVSEYLSYKFLNSSYSPPFQTATLTTTTTTTTNMMTTHVGAGYGLGGANHINNNNYFFNNQFY
jgi:hypothetical protein